MANTISPFGFRSWSHRDGSAPTAGFDTLYIASSDTSLYFTGDPVASNTTGPYIQIPSTSTVQIAGIFAGCEYWNAGASRMQWAPWFPGTVTGSTADIKAYVITDPEMLFLVQTSSVAAITSSQVNLNVGWLNATSSLGSQTSGVSNVSLNSTTVGSTNTLPFRIVGLYSNWGPPGTNGMDNTTAGNFVIVAPNNWDRKNLTGI